MAEMTDREKEFELLGMGVEDLEKMIVSRSEQQNIPITEILIDWLELAQYQLEDKYRNVHHIINRIVYVLHTGMVVDNTEKKKKPAKKEKGAKKKD
ncbi:MAG: hypothetical protein RIG61_07240 [Deltaproteobacteria bacterium]